MVANPSAEEREVERVNNKIPMAKTIITPETRCNIEAFAAGCIFIVVRSIFTGRFFFTIVA